MVNNNPAFRDIILPFNAHQKLISAEEQLDCRDQQSVFSFCAADTFTSVVKVCNPTWASIVILQSDSSRLRTCSFWRCRLTTSQRGFISAKCSFLQRSLKFILNKKPLQMSTIVLPPCAAWITDGDAPSLQ